MAIQQVQTSILSVSPNPTASGKQAWDVILADGTEIRAWEPHEAQKAMAFLNLPSLVTYTEVQKGQYTNRGFKDVQALPVATQNGQAAFPPNFNPNTGQALPGTTYPSQGTSLPGTIPAPGASRVVISAPQSVQATPSLRDSLINRQSAAKSATAFLAPLVAAGVPVEEAMTHVRGLIRELEEYILTGNLADTPSDTGGLELASTGTAKAPWED